MKSGDARMKYAISGRLAAYFQNNQITPLIALMAALMGLFAVAVTPREEEPQIDVTFANVYIGLPGATAREVEQLIAAPAEQVLDEMSGVKHVYSVSLPGMAVVTVRFEVGIKRRDAIVRLYNQVQSNADWLPATLGATPPLIKPMGIDDVPIMTLTLWSDDANYGTVPLQQVAHALESELKRIPGTRMVRTHGGGERVVRVTLDNDKMQAYGVDFAGLEQAIQMGNQVAHSGHRVSGNRSLPVQAGTLLSSADDVADLVVSVYNNRPVYLRDVASVSDAADTPDRHVWIRSGAAWDNPAPARYDAAVTLSIGKKPGTNAVAITAEVMQALERLQHSHIPDGVHHLVTRDYGQSANDKANQLIKKLLFATASVVLLMGFALGWREALVVGLAVGMTLAMTLFASWAYGFTLNRVSLFALIFSIGILVDDAVVIVENIHRHAARGTAKLWGMIPAAVDEVGGPTILATFTVMAALMPMAFVSGLMGPYMSPIPINASMGMLLSLLIALMVTPWLYAHIIGERATTQHESADRGRRLFAGVLQPFLKPQGGRLARYLLVAGVVLLMGLSVWLVPAQGVIMKMLPFDNKSEIQVVLDMPEGSTVEHTNAVLVQMSEALHDVPEIVHITGYAGLASPINFNGLVRQYFQRESPHMGDLQIGLLDKAQRDRQSHEVALAIRPALQAIAQQAGGSVKVVEVPPGPPVLAPLVAEVYGPDAAGRRELALKIEGLFNETPHLTDVDTSVEAESPRQILVVDRAKAALLGLSQIEISRAVTAAISGVDVSWLHDDTLKYAVPIRLALAPQVQGEIDTLLSVPVRNRDGRMIVLGEVVHVQQAPWEAGIHRKDLMPLDRVTGDVAGGQDSPLYGMLSVIDRVQEAHPEVQHLYTAQPASDDAYAIKWDGEWQITFETFRDMGIAYSVGLVLIYLLIVAQFHAYFVPLIIMVPIPLTVIGILPGHWLAGAQFTATSMIGMIALAGIIVRNSILLVDFIRLQVRQGQPLRQAVIDSAAVRAKPIALTAVAAMMGAFFILDDPIFNGLAVALISGIFISTLLTLVIIPVLYFWYASRRLNRGLTI